MYEVVINPGTDIQTVLLYCKSWLVALQAKREYERAGYTVDVMKNGSTEF